MLSSYSRPIASLPNLPLISGYIFWSNNSCIEDFILCLNPDYRYLIPEWLFSFQHLRHLHLQGVKLPLTFEGFKKLVTLILIDVRNELGMLHTFTSQCPMLEFLMVEFVDDTELYSLHVVGPNLKTFEFCGLCTSICLECPRIKKVSLDFRGFEYWEVTPASLFDDGELFDSCVNHYSNLVEVFSQMASIEIVHLRSRGLMEVHDFNSIFLILGVCSFQCSN